MNKHMKQLSLDLDDIFPSNNGKKGQAIDINGVGNKLAPEDKHFHDWYRFVLSFPAHLVKHYISSFELKNGQVILDPFCGTGTTLICAKQSNIESIGIEANPFAYFASTVKVNWDIIPERMIEVAREICVETLACLNDDGINDKILSVTPKIDEL